MSTHVSTKSSSAVPVTSPRSAESSSVVATGPSAPTTPTAPSTTSSTVVLSNSPPPLALPSIPAGYIAVNRTVTGGYFPRATEVEAAPAAVSELSGTTTFVQRFGPAAPAQGSFLALFTVAVAWTVNRVALENYLQYTRAQEGLAWKAVAPELEQFKAVFDLTAAQDSSLTKDFPALARLFAAGATIGKKAAATRKRKAAAARAATTATSSTTAAPSATNPGTTTPATTSAATANGGAAH